MLPGPFVPWLLCGTNQLPQETNHDGHDEHDGVLESQPPVGGTSHSLAKAPGAAKPAVVAFVPVVVI